MEKKHSTRKSRQGVHKAGQTRIHCYIDPKIKAIVALIGERIGTKDMTATTIECYRRAALSLGIIDDEGNVCDFYKNRFELKLFDIKLTK